MRRGAPWTAALVVVAACGGPDVSTPRGAMRALHEALVDGDFDRAVEFVQGTAEEKRVARAMLEFTAAAYRFHRRMVDAYGQAGWDRFNDGEGISLSFAMAEESWPERIEFEEEGEDRVLASDPADPEAKAPLVREDGRWKLAWGEAVAGRNVPGVKVLRNLKGLVESRLDDIGEEGVTPDSLDTEMGAAFQKIWAER
jgi:hypothetical protein